MTKIICGQGKYHIAIKKVTLPAADLCAVQAGIQSLGSMVRLGAI